MIILMAEQMSFTDQKVVLGQSLSLLTKNGDDFEFTVQKCEKEIISLYKDGGLTEKIY